MTSKIAKGFSLCTAIIGLLCLLTGVGIAICAWVLNGTLPEGFHYKTKRDGVQLEGKVSIGNYWWGGMIYILPGILGIVAGCTRSVTAMVLYLIFNLICCICSLVVVVMCALVLLVWVTIDNLLQNPDKCSSTLVNTCSCTDSYTDDSFTLFGGNCEVFMSVQAVIGAMISMAAVSSILSFIASYISCCSLCNQDRTNMGNIIISGGAGVYQPPPVVVSNTTSYPAYPPQHHHTNMPMPGAYPYPPQNNVYPPPPYAQQDGNPNYGHQGAYNAIPCAPVDEYPVTYPTNDTSNLINNEYR